MMNDGELSVGFLDLELGGIGAYTQGVVVGRVGNLGRHAADWTLDLRVSAIRSSDQCSSVAKLLEDPAEMSRDVHRLLPATDAYTTLRDDSIAIPSHPSRSSNISRRKMPPST